MLKISLYDKNVRQKYFYNRSEISLFLFTQKSISLQVQIDIISNSDISKSSLLKIEKRFSLTTLICHF